MTQPIVQFGTSRFLLAHADLFVSDALHHHSGAGNALGGITIVQTTSSSASTARRAALTAGGGYPVVIRGLERGQPVDRTVQCTAVREAMQATQLDDWQRLRADVASGAVQLILSNTADKGYQLDVQDNAQALQTHALAPNSYPAKLLVLLHGRWSESPTAPLTFLPCELIERNGDVLCQVVCELAQAWQLESAFIEWIQTHCVWANSLVDRIVSEAIEPVGAVAEPYALWAIEAKDRLQLPCTHPSIVVTDDLDHYEQLKLFLLNAAHTYLAECWLKGQRRADETVREAMQDAALRAEIEALWAEEIVPVFGSQASAGYAQAVQYVADVRERFENPFLNHRIADIAQNHEQKKLRRLAPVVAKAQELQLNLPQLRLRAALAS
ncbi:mannitol dehydrogenase family protein [Lampropedia puyangensis]|uniref:Mannitol dehydrogenase family protein n=1 Tax=Lampropedia puyangensis TaxID=1330072 RepID=A0A4S8FDS7_9BURK|nr:mannitol dehydrogenase family protein [Lampropedia puyangensis]THU04052.1 mannitol dehydrogenase family protein [Lampropedia puyangensis]